MRDHCKYTIQYTIVRTVIILYVSSTVKYITTESTLRDGCDRSNPDKASIEREKELIAKYKGVLGCFIHEDISLQIEAIYALQVRMHKIYKLNGLAEYVDEDGCIDR